MSSGAGRFAVGAMSPLIQAFFETTAASQLEPGSYSKAEMATFLGLTYYGFAFQAYEFADGTDDIVERTFVFNSQKFRINDSAVFVVEADGTRHIDNFWIEPDQRTPRENFDFESNDDLAQWGNALLEARIDPWGIGRKVEFSFAGTPVATSYDAADYAADLIRIDAWRAAAPLLAPVSLLPQFYQLADELFDAGITNFTDTEGRVIVYGKAGDDNIHVDAQLSQLIVNGEYLATAAPLLASSWGHGLAVLGGDGDDDISATDLSDVLKGMGGNDTLEGLDGIDKIAGGEGDDRMDGGEGNDRLDGGTGNDVIVGGAGADTCIGGDGDDVIVTGLIDGSELPCNEVVYDGAGKDYIVITGAEGSTVTIRGGDGQGQILIDARLVGLDGGDGDGQELFRFSGGLILGEYADGQEPGLTEEEDGTRFWTYTYYSEPFVAGTGQGWGDLFDTKLINFDHYRDQNTLIIHIFDPPTIDEPGSADTQTIVIEDFQNGDFGIDLLQGNFYVSDGGELDGHVIGDSSVDDNIAYNRAVKSLNESSRGWKLQGDDVGNLKLTFNGSDVAERLDGSDRDDDFSGGGGDDHLNGLASDDILSGGEGNDTLTGGAGADALDGGEGTDRASYAASLLGVVVDLALGKGLGGDAEGDTLFGIEYLTGSRLADGLTGNDDVNRLMGLAGDDILDGMGGNDILVGGLGADMLIGGEGDRDAADYGEAASGVAVDLVSGGTGGEAAGDTYSGIEYVYGSAFDDTIRGEAGVNRLVGGFGNDILDGREGNDILVGGLGADTLIGGAGDRDVADYSDAPEWVRLDLATGGTYGDAEGDNYSGVEYVYGSQFGDTIRGDAGVNRLVGNGGRDALDGAGGIDYLIGGLGEDVLTGGEGADVFQFEFGAFGDDTITDFWAGGGRTDRIWLQGQGVMSFDDLLANHCADTGEGALITCDGGSILIEGVTKAQLNVDDFIFT